MSSHYVTQKPPLAQSPASQRLRSFGSLFLCSSATIERFSAVLLSQLPRGQGYRYARPCLVTVASEVIIFTETTTIETTAVTAQSRVKGEEQCQRIIALPIKDIDTLTYKFNSILCFVQGTGLKWRDKNRETRLGIVVHTSKPSIRETEALGRPRQQDRELKACPRYTTKLRGKHQKQNKQNSSKTTRKIFKVNSSLHINTMDSDIHEGHSCMCTRQRARTHAHREREGEKERNNKSESFKKCSSLAVWWE